jgi:hypothetical protein
MKKLQIPKYLLILSLLVLPFSFLLWADSWQIGTIFTDGNSNGNQKMTDDTSQTSDQGQTINDHQSSERRPDGSGHDHETVSGNGDFDPDGKWNKEGGGWEQTTDRDISPDGSSSEQTTQTQTDKDGNKDIWTSSTTYGPDGKKNSENKNHVRKPGGSRVLRPVKAGL